MKLKDILQPTKKLIESRNGTPDLPTNLTDLDEYTFGLHKKELTVIGGRPSQGKSSLALWIAIQLANIGKKILFFSLEMSKEQLCERIIANLCRIDNWKLRQGSQIPKERFDMVDKMVQEMKLDIIDDSGYSYEDIILEAVGDSHHFMENQAMYDVVFIDYIQMISWVKNYRSKLDAIEEYVRELHNFAKKFNVAVVVVSQVNRGATQHKESRPTMSELKNSGSLEEVSDCVLLCYYPYKYNSEKYTQEEFYIIVEKNRHGPTGLCTVKFEPLYYDFKEK